MLRVSRLADYASVVMTCLAQHPDEVWSAVAVGEATRLEQPTVAKLLKRLGQAGLVESFRGANGGYRLARAPADISLAAIIEALDGPIGLTECSVGRGCPRRAYCDIADSWQGIGAAIDHALRGVSLADLVRHRPARLRRPAARAAAVPAV
jgi:FeS assembly SUF system regulator